MNLSLEDIRRVFMINGATKILLKPLAENDNSKQQVYIGGSFDVLTALPFKEVVADSSAKLQNFKAAVDFYWLSPNGEFVQAKHTQLILYPSYPEVRLSGFLRGCPVAPSEHMQPIEREKRGPKNQWDGRVLFMGITPDGKILAHLALPSSAATHDFQTLRDNGEINHLADGSPLYILDISATKPDTRNLLLAELARIHTLDWTDSVRMNSSGSVVPYVARNGGGYTLEALLGVKPNGRSEPDFLGWEVKGHSVSKITLMTPEPDQGHYGLNGAEAFVRKYGYVREDGVFYFTGTHRVNTRHAQTGQILTLEGFDAAKAKITNVDGGIYMTDKSNNASAIWTYPGLITHWGRKHANAVYVRYEVRKTTPPQYRFKTPARLGVGTNFTKYLQAMHLGEVVYDPATKYTPATATTKGRVKARNQFRIATGKLKSLYDDFVEESL